MLHPPLPVTIGTLDIGAIVLAKPVLGTAMTFAAHGDFAVGAGRAEADLALQRTDGTPGSATLHVAYGGAVPLLHLRAAIERTHRDCARGAAAADESLPLALALSGDGPLDDWRGRLQATAGSAASVAASFRIAGSTPYRLSASGEAHLAPLLPPTLRPLIGETVAVNAMVALAPESIAVDRLT